MSVRVDTASFSAALRRLAALNNKTQGEMLMGFARTTLRNPQGTGIIDMTPPASPDAKGFDARRQGEGAIDRDLARIFIGARLKKNSHRKERWPDVAGIHRAAFMRKAPGKPMKKIHQKFHVDAVKLKQLARALKGRVGRMASSWMASANRLGVKVPNWISRHGSGPGSCKVGMQAPQFFVAMEAFPHANTPTAELQRRVNIALGFTQERVVRAAAGAEFKANAKKAGFKVAA